MLPLLTLELPPDFPDNRLFGLDSQTLVQVALQFLSVAVLAVALIWLLYKPVGKFLAARKARIEGDLASAEKDKQEAATLKDGYAQAMSNAHHERDDILRDARKKATEKGDQILFEAQREAEAHTNRALAHLEVETKSAELEIRRQVVEISTLLAERFVQVSIDAKTQDKLIDEAFAGWEKR